jgi:transposase
MEILYPCCAGLDIHKKTVVACLRSIGPTGEVQQDVLTFGTMTAELLALADWLAQAGVVQVAMESTGVYWKPVFHLLEDRFQVMLVNAQHIKQVPGRKTDVKDCQWIAQLLQHGLLRPSFVPPVPIRELRDLTRQRSQLVAERAAVSNRIQKVLEDANIKLASVASDVLGVSGRAMIGALIGGEDQPDRLAELARRKLRGKIPQLKQALRGHVTEHHRFMLRTLMDHVRHLEDLIERLSQRIEAVMSPSTPAGDGGGTPPAADPIEEATNPSTPAGDGDASPAARRIEAAPPPLAAAVERLVTIPGVSQHAAEGIAAEVGTDMTRFPTAGHLSSWAGMCPGNHQSAGKRQSGRTTKGNRWLRRTLVQVAWAASHTKDTALAATYRRWVKRMGKKRALVALAHKILVIIYHVLKEPTIYRESQPAEQPA